MKSSNSMSESDARWPFATMAFLGHFGADTAAGKRLSSRMSTGVLVFLLAVVPTFSGQRLLPGPNFVPAVVAAGAMAGIVWAFFMYLRELDDLGRLIQLEALATAYGCALVLSALVGTLDMVQSIPNPALWILFAEPIRAVALALIARRYQ